MSHDVKVKIVQADTANNLEKAINDFVKGDKGTEGIGIDSIHYFAVYDTANNKTVFYAAIHTIK